MAIEEKSGEPIAFNTNLGELVDEMNRGARLFRVDRFELKRTVYRRKRQLRQ